MEPARLPEREVTVRKATLGDGTRVWCIRPTEARVLDSHVEGYLDHGIHVGESGVIFDVGANIGVFAVRAVQRSQGVRVFAFEPVPTIHAALAANARDLGDGRVVPLNCGASDAPGQATFTYFPRSPALSTANPEAWDEDPTEFQTAVTGITRDPPPGMGWLKLVPSFLSPLIAWFLRSNAQRVTATLRTLSSVIDEHDVREIDLLKVDCEGAELPALRGVDPEHWPMVRQVVVEVHDRDGALSEILTLLAAAGFDEVVTAKEAGFEDTRLVNVYARRSTAPRSA